MHSATSDEQALEVVQYLLNHGAQCTEMTRLEVEVNLLDHNFPKTRSVLQQAVEEYLGAASDDVTQYLDILARIKRSGY